MCDFTKEKWKLLKTTYKRSLQILAHHGLREVILKAFMCSPITQIHGDNIATTSTI